MARRNINMEYANVPKAPSTPPISSNDKKWLTLVLLSFGLLCILQATLNVTLRIFLYSDTSILDPDGICNNFTVQKQKDLDQYLQNGWVYFNTSFYYISLDKRNWQDSRTFCHERGSDLIVINSKDEQEFTRRFHRFMWIGLRSISQGQWMWVDNTSLVTSYWAPQEPSEGNKDCVQGMLFEIEDTWSSLNCENKTYWICEKKMAL
ncbi:hypothetical protein NL108_005040 [Boleophthalmus pectinirostris]|nr:hypothetical protein NL108_005040 [Boleophthalmus pectinirostris]